MKIFELPVPDTLSAMAMGWPYKVIVGKYITFYFADGPKKFKREEIGATEIPINWEDCSIKGNSVFFGDFEVETDWILNNAKN